MQQPRPQPRLLDELRLQVRCCGELVGVRVGFQDVADSVAISGYEGEESGGRGSVDGGCGGRVVEDRVDDDAGVG